MTTSTARVIDYGDRGRVNVFANTDDLAQAVAGLVVTTMSEAVAARGVGLLALSGGSTPKQMGQLLQQEPFRSSTPWGSLRVFWGDERWAPLDDPESNAGEAIRGWLNSVPANKDQLHPFEYGDDPEASAKAYEAAVRSQVPGEPFPRFDLILLGMGGDGHTASLFPGTSALTVTDRLVVANPVPAMETVRLTFTAPLINAARNVAFLVAGSGKADRLHAVLDGNLQPTELPAQLIRPTTGELRWLVDKSAAAKLDRNP